MTPEERASADEKPRAERRRLRVAAEKEPRGERRRPRVPTSVLLTLLVAVLSILVGPAFARQWEDRQNARELKAAIADEIASATARTLGAGVYVARAQQAQARRDRFVNARAFWRPASRRIEMKLKAYFPASMADEWKQLVLDIDDFLENVCARASPQGQPFKSDLTASSRRANIAAWFESSSKLRPLPDSLQNRTPSEIAHSATRDNAEDRAEVIDAGGQWMFAETDKMTAVLFDAHPAGFSTNRRDLLQDLLP